MPSKTFQPTPKSGVADRHGLDCQWDAVPGEAFMVLVLDETIMPGVSGVARYREGFDEETSERAKGGR